jgi:signal transduction histidine kinase
LDDELHQALENAKSANVTMCRLLRTVAHEFRTPLGLLTGSTDILDHYWDRLTPEKRFEQNEHIRSAARQLDDLINSVVSFNRQETNSVGNFPVLLDVRTVCSAIAAEVETVWGAGHTMSVTIADDCGAAMLDEILFRRILENLLTNAFRYTQSDGTVSMNILRENSSLCLEIRDTGIGIPEEDQVSIFDAFYRSRNVEGRRGMGLGLSIVYESLAQMGGIITVNSKIGEGTTMRVEIPVDDSV